MKLVSDWRRALRWNSMRVMGLIALIPVIWEAVPPELHLWIPDTWRPWVFTALALGGMAGRIIDQGEPND